ncbi:hypothetical protein LR48_Vigan01g097000 [Vigna angularis]|uniref:Uncharacterized protein n=1 Tax=Phaseolus angularis TaxID=3914 RepID=A0A0L9TLH7_PHAAN|nr:uncharacterized protein HKW66_Vig0001880 [Vigna angularis]KOM31415.1 hypothetical protein LR48_Vigan01g097000 [Vigna angularis]
MCGGAIIVEFLPRTGHKLISAFLWPELDLYDLSNRECSCILENDETLLRFVKRTRIASQSECCFSCTPLNPHSYLSSINKFQSHQHTGWSLNAEISNKGRENHCNNSGKRKLCDRNVNLADNLEYCPPTLTKGSDEEDSYEISDTSSDSSLDSSSDSETYSGPS